MNKKISVLIIENDLDFVYLINKLLQDQSDIVFTGSASNKEDGLRLACELGPDIVLMDLNLSEKELDGIETSKEIRRLTNAKVVILTSFMDSKTVIYASMKSFAAGYIFKSQYKSIPQVIRNTIRGTTPDEIMIRTLILNQLTSAEIAVLKNVIEGESNFYSSNKTIANQKTNIYKKLGLKNQKEVEHILRDYFT